MNWRLWIRQVGAVLRLELKKALFSCRACRVRRTALWLETSFSSTGCSLMDHAGPR